MTFFEPKIFGLKDVLTFGKYKGKTIKEVILEDAQYINWAYSNITWFDLDAITIDYLTPRIIDSWLDRIGIKDVYDYMD